MKATIIIIGDEILLGRVTDTNSGTIARALDPLGIEIDKVITVGDEGKAIHDAVDEAFKATDLVIVTGGLGPTKDDITKKVLMEVFGGELIFDEKVYEQVQKIFLAKNLNMNRLTHDQALVPTSCKVIQNLYGTAPIMWFEKDGKVLVSMPGVPAETAPMINGPVREAIAGRFTPDTAYAHRTLQVTGISESALAERLESWEDSLPKEFHLAYLPDSPIIRLRIDGSGKDAEKLEKDIDDLADTLDARLGHLVFARGEGQLAQVLLDKLRERKLTLCTAESCTGGNIAHTITLVPGSSDVFNGGIVSYSNNVKEKALGVPQETLDEFGAVSEQTVRAMLAGALRATDSDCAVATSGIAGPGGGTPDKPVGTVYIGAQIPGLEPLIVRHQFPGSRERIIHRATTAALLQLMQLLTPVADASPEDSAE